MPTATLTSKGQITLPKEVRDVLRLATGDQVDFVIASDGHVELRSLRRSVREFYGVLYRADQPPVSLDDMSDALPEQASDDDERSRK